MKKFVFPRYSVIALTVVFLIACLGLTVKILNNNNVYIYTSLLNFERALLVIFFIGCSLFASAAIVFAHRNLKSRILKIIIVAVITFISLYLFVMASVPYLLFAPVNYAENISDDGQHHIIIGEDSYFFSPYGGDIYEKTSLGTMKKIGRYYAETDFHTPFSNNDYFIVWNKDDFEIHYDHDGVENEYEILTVRYAGD